MTAPTEPGQREHYPGPRTRRFVSSWLRGTRRSTTMVAFFAALLVTVVVAGPLAYRAARSTAPKALAPELLIYRAYAGGPPVVLNGATVSQEIYVRYEGSDAIAVAFNLAPQDDPSGELLVQSVDGDGPPFDFITDDAGNALPFDTTSVPDGTYDLLVSVTTKDDRAERTAARFTVENS